jgi:hypothetical protein
VEPVQNLLFCDLNSQTVPFIVYNVRSFAKLQREGTDLFAYAVTNTHILRVKWETIIEYPINLDKDKYPPTVATDSFQFTE